ncbi:hypothetical protein [Dyadobacter arcticus]|uniref:DUF3592 domain-containing protein n=1 Tax=Dyadobacter arcticus TaxID=1078754 RepID=A0ABX0UPT5_9BACT|nr:hypothetical protein [Dyadobacter arcticus]NIJ55008.1 hypothetical protein [Dyadobacter arcticus]
MELIIIQISYLVQAGVVLLLLIIAFKIIKALKSAPQTVAQRILKHGSEARAKVLSTEHVPGLQDQIKLLLQVEPKSGRNFVVEIVANTQDNDVIELHCGSTVSVMYNPINRQQVVLTGKL